MTIFERLESEVRGYCRSFPATFTHAAGAHLTDDRGREYIDFFAGAGALNYGHNEPRLRDALVEYIQSGGVVHTLDLHTRAKEQLLETFEELVLKPRKLDWKVMFPGPTGTNAVEAALKLARKVTGRSRVVGFTNGFHGMTLGSLAVTGNAEKRAGAGLALSHATSVPFDGYMDGRVDTLELFERLVVDQSSGLDLPAAVIVETVQAEGGVNVAEREWLRGLRRITRERGILMIVDDIQVGCGRTGPFFSFETVDGEEGIEPDIVTLSKSLSGFGLPFALTLFRRDLDVWDPGEHNGTFRGFNPAMVTARVALENYWRDDTLTRQVNRNAATIRDRFAGIAERCRGMTSDIRGRGMIQGIECRSSATASEVSRLAFERGLMIETAGARGDVVKALPPLTIDADVLTRGMDILEDAFVSAYESDWEEEPTPVPTPSVFPRDMVIHAGGAE